jgi:hypothetical protein
MAVIKKSSIAIISILILVVSVLAEMQVAKVAEANPVPYPSTPSTELPTLVIRSKKNYSDYYAEGTFKLDFIIIQPESWN